MEPQIQSGGFKGVKVDASIPDAPSQQVGSKNCHRWCKGKAGTEHNAVWQFWFSGHIFERFDYQRLKCLNCGRVLKIRVVPSDKPSHPRA